MVCAACLSGLFRENKLIPEVTLKTCLTCGLLVGVIERTGSITREFARINEEAYHRSVSRVRQQQACTAIAFVESHTSKKGDWLDIGCSFGYLLREAERAGYKVFGVEPDAKASEHARELIGCQSIHHGMMSNDTRPDNSADVISMMDVLEHIPISRLPGFARMVYNKLRPEGVWLIKVPSTDGLYFTLAHRFLRFAAPLTSATIKRLWQSEYEFPHTVYFNQSTLQRYLENHGFQVVDFSYIEDVPNNTVIDRLLMDSTIPRWQAYLISPVFYLINLVEKCRGKSDALMMLARR
jgi:cyclopropane fatty-acyl-phospholipid synthase-like methyltransferase